MGVPDEVDGPIRKRPRLSLQKQHKPALNSNSTEMLQDKTEGPCQSPVLQDRTLCTNDCIDLTADLPASADPPVGPVASLHNLGNTCFLNSMLEVLRYTPGFVDGLGSLQKDIRAFENKVKDEEDSCGTESDLRSVWQIVKNTYSMYAEMDSKEEQHKEVATSDASSMAVRPSVLLDNIRELNPMFEGHFQHDAQELLRCLLCYIEDAEKELKRERDKEEMKTERDEQVLEEGNRSSERFLKEKTNATTKKIDGKCVTGNGISLKGGDSRRGDGARGSKGKERPINAAASSFMENFLGGKNHQGQVTKKEKLDENLGGVERGSDVSNETTVEDDEVDGLVIISNGNKTLSHGENGQEDSKANLTAICSSDRRGRKRRRSRSNSNSQKTVPEKDITVKKRSIIRPEKKSDNISCENKSPENSTVSNGEKTRGEISETDSSSGGLLLKLQQKLSLSPSKNVSKSSSSGRHTIKNDLDSSKQPSILSMFPLNQVRRLGMRGRVMFDSVSRAITKTADDSTGNGAIGNDSNNNITNSNGIGNGDSNNNGDNSDSNNNDDYNNNNHSNNNNSNINFNHLNSSPNGHGHIESLRLGQSGEMDTSSITNTRSVNSLRGSVTPTKNLTGLHSQSPIKSPIRSPLMIEHSDEISPLKDKEMINIESTIDSVTKKYYSTLPQSRRRATSSVPTVPSSPKSLGNTNFELVIPSPGALASNSTSEDSAVATSPYHQLQPDEELIVHSPSKTGVAFSVPVRISPRKRSELSSLDTEIVLPGTEIKRGEKVSCSETFSTALYNVTPGTMARKLLKPLSVTTDEFLHFENTTKAFLHSLQGHLPGPKSSSAPNSPADRLLRNPRTVLPSPNKLTPNGKPAGKPITPGANHCLNQSPVTLKLELKKCDWLGVSPAKSISAKKAISAINSKSPSKTLDKGILSARRKITYDSSDSNDKNNKNVVSSKPLSNRNQLSVSSFFPFSSTKQIISSETEDFNTCKETSSTPQTLNTGKAAPSKSIRKPRQRTLDSSQPLSKSSERVSRQKNSGKLTVQEPMSSLTLTRGITLRPLSISLDNCDWLLDAKAGKTVSAKRVLKDLKKCNSVNPVKTLSSSDRYKMAGRETSMDNTTWTFSGMKQKSGASTLVEQLFGGTMMHRTKCLECERARERREVFLDISVPIRSLDEGQKDSDDEKEDDDEKSKESCLAKLMQAFSSVERLQGSNKYFCEECEHYVEAERSCHYTTLPAVLTLHLKRFSANSGLFGGVSKLNDKVTIPQNLPCLSYQCKKSCKDPDHQYSLFAIVTHSGMSILHGHYRAYVKVQPQFNPTIFHSLLTSRVKDEIMDIEQTQENVLLTTDPPLNHSVSSKESELKNSLTNKNKISANGDRNSSMQSYAKNSRSSKGLKIENGRIGLKQEIADECSGDETTLLTELKPESFWLECDDECIKVMDESEFVDKLEERDGTLMGTPYVLFYHKLVMS